MRTFQSAMFERPMEIEYKALIKYEVVERMERPEGKSSERLAE